MSWFKTFNSYKKIQKAQKGEKIIFQKKVENVDLRKPVLNKIMTTQDWCGKYDFVAPLTILISVLLCHNLDSSMLACEGSLI